MQVSSHADTPLTSGGHLLTSVGINGSHNTNQAVFANQTKQFILEHVDPSTLEDDDSDSDDGVGISSHVHSQSLHLNQTLQNMSPVLSGPKPGKKTKGRVKIKMEFIENKLRRYTTFSKRKTGIMKKAYELSTLTGTQVMLLVASETGHVYTFATRKLQPMITSESGKALIQTCLNSPDPPPFSPGQEQAVEQRMNPSGFEETELTCTVGEEEGKAGLPGMQEGVQGKAAIFPVPTMMSDPQQTHHSSPSPAPVGAYVNSSLVTVTPTSAPTLSKSTMATSAAAHNISMQLPTSLILQPGTPISIPVHQGSHSIPSQQQQQQQQQQQHTIYRIPSNQLVSVAGGQLTTNNNESSQPPVSSSTTTPSSITMVSDGLLSGSTASLSSGAAALTPGIVMYQTPQGVVYATPTTTLGDRTIFNFQQPGTAISLAQQDQTDKYSDEHVFAVGSGTQQIIIPVPVSLANSGQVFQLTTAAPVIDSGQVEIATPPIKKSRK